MIKGQIMPNKIINKNIISIISSLPRHLFVPEIFKAISYSDETINLTDLRYVMPPMVFAKMLQAIDLKDCDVVLDVACGSGYSSSVLAHLAKKVVAIECDPELASRANFIINKLDIGNIIVLNNKLAGGHPDGAPYDVIFCNGALSKTPHDLLDQLAENGRLITILKGATGGNAVLFHKKEGIVIKNDLFNIDLPIIADFEDNSEYAH